VRSWHESERRRFASLQCVNVESELHCAFSRPYLKRGSIHPDAGKGGEPATRSVANPGRVQFTPTPSVVSH
jgi:hypothetical protein